jgi:hypothetical protein
MDTEIIQISQLFDNTKITENKAIHKSIQIYIYKEHNENITLAPETVIICRVFWILF